MDHFTHTNKPMVAKIIEYIRKNYAVGITKSRNIVRRLIMDLIEGDATKQYTLLWRYDVELTKRYRGNTCKLQLERPSLALQPRFGSFYLCLDGCKKGFVVGCRPFIGLDGCHIKTKYGGSIIGCY